MATESEKRTPVYDWEAGDFKRDLAGNVVTVTEGEAVEQIVIKALQTARSLYVIYFDNEEPSRHNKYGSDVHDIAVRRDLTEAVRIDEMKRALGDALIHDPWITDVYEIQITRQGHEEAVASFKIATIFDNEVTVEGVGLNG